MSQNKWLQVLCCPKCKGSLEQVQHNDATGLLCKADALVFPIRDGMPIMLIEQAEPLSTQNAG